MIWFFLILFGLPIFVMLVGLYVIWLLIQGIAFAVMFVIEYLDERAAEPEPEPGSAAYSNRR